MSEQSAKSCSTNQSHTQLQTNTKPRCAHLTSDGRRCRLRVLDSRSGLCFRHLQLSQNQSLAADPEAVAAELLAGIEDFASADSMNIFLGNLVKQLAYKRIARPDAIALAYIGQLLLNSLPAMRREYELEREADGCRELVESILRARAARAEQDQQDEANTGPAR